MSLLRTYRVRCDTCGTTGPASTDSKTARREARRGGWRRIPWTAERGPRDACPVCAVPR